MSTSLPSKKIPIVNAPEVDDLNASFTYNFFTPDEKINETGNIAPKFITNNPAESFDSEFIKTNNFQSRVPRYVKLSWKPVIKSSQRDIIQNYYRDRFIANKFSIKDNASTIKEETDFVEANYVPLQIQDDGLDKKLSYFIDKLLDQLKENKGNKERSFLDIAKVLNDLTPDDISGNFLSSVLFDLKKQGLHFIDKVNKEKITKNIVQTIQNSKVNIKLNQKVLSQIALTSIENPTSIFSDEAKEIYDDFNQIQNNAYQNKDSSIFDDQEYDFEIDKFLRLRSVTDKFDSVAIPVGYIIEKYEVSSDNKSIIQKESIYIENPFSSTTVDLKVKFDGKYVYTIKSVNFIEISAQEKETGEILAVSFLISSQASKQINVFCSESVPPPPPTDFNILWDYKQQCSLLMWTFPPNQQRDIKHFQVFRRTSIDKPFELIKMYNFDDSVVLSEINETPSEFLVEELDGPKNFFYDKEFTKDSKFIYCICSMDAHGFSSNYSMQLEVSFDRFKNKINKKLISVAGAPKSYPNMYLNQDTFVDVIKDSNHKRLNIYFNPEFLNIVDHNNQDLKLIKTDKNCSYRMQIINSDLQKEHVVNIKIEDRRTTKDKNEVHNVDNNV